MKLLVMHLRQEHAFGRSFAVATLLAAFLLGDGMARANDVFELSFTAHCRFQGPRGLAERDLNARDLVLMASGFASNFPAGSEQPSTVNPISKSQVLALVTDCSQNFSIVVYDTSVAVPADGIVDDLGDISLASSNTYTLLYFEYYPAHAPAYDGCMALQLNGCDCDPSSFTGEIFADIEFIPDAHTDCVSVSGTGTGWMNFYPFPVDPNDNLVQFNMTRVTFSTGRKLASY